MATATATPFLCPNEDGTGLRQMTGGDMPDMIAAIKAANAQEELMYEAAVRCLFDHHTHTPEDEGSFYALWAQSTPDMKSPVMYAYACARTKETWAKIAVAGGTEAKRNAVRGMMEIIARLHKRPELLADVQFADNYETLHEVPEGRVTYHLNMV